MAQAPRDQNRVTTLLGVSSVDFATPTAAAVDPTTHEVLTQSTGSSGASSYATKVTVSGLITYVGKAVPGTAQASALWQAQKIDETTGTIITWADGNASFDNVATDLTALTYS